MLSGSFVKDRAVTKELVLIDKGHSEVEEMSRLADALGFSPSPSNLVYSLAMLTQLYVSYF